jgi:hypothetical protein
MHPLASKYTPSCDREPQVTSLREAADNETYALVSLYPDLPTPVVASAWASSCA